MLFRLTDQAPLKSIYLDVFHKREIQEVAGRNTDSTTHSAVRREVG